MIDEIPYEQVVRRHLERGAVKRRDFPGFREDYLAIHCLLREHGPERLFEIGTSTGRGTKVICKAMSSRRWGKPDTAERVLSLDVPPGTDASIIYPHGEDGHPEQAGSDNPFPYTQLFGDSKTFDIAPYLPIDAWFIDGKHDYEHARSDTELALKCAPGLIIWHDLQIDEVERAVVDTVGPLSQYRVRRVAGTRVGYAVRAAAG
jgi:methyltransferase family protein